MSAVHVIERVARIPEGWVLLVDYHFDGEAYDYTLRLPGAGADASDEEIEALMHRPEIVQALRRMFLEDVYLVGGRN